MKTLIKIISLAVSLIIGVVAITAYIGLHFYLYNALMPHVTSVFGFAGDNFTNGIAFIYVVLIMISHVLFIFGAIIIMDSEP